MGPGDLLLRLGTAALLGSLIGLDRQRLDKAAGLRTHMLVSVGSALVMIVSAYGFDAVLQPGRVVLDPSRVAAQVVSGIGFLGAGTIVVQEAVGARPDDGRQRLGRRGDRAGGWRRPLHRRDRRDRDHARHPGRHQAAGGPPARSRSPRPPDGEADRRPGRSLLEAIEAPFRRAGVEVIGVRVRDGDAQASERSR